jgi:hypothetical protein
MFSIFSNKIKKKMIVSQVAIFALILICYIFIFSTERDLFEMLTVTCGLLFNQKKTFAFVQKEKTLIHINKAPTAHLRKSERTSNDTHSAIYNK